MVFPGDDDGATDVWNLSYSENLTALGGVHESRSRVSSLLRAPLGIRLDRSGCLF